MCGSSGIVDYWLKTLSNLWLSIVHVKLIIVGVNYCWHFSGYLRWLLRLNGSKTDFLMEQMESETNLLSVLQEKLTITKNKPVYTVEGLQTQGRQEVFM